MTGSRSLPGGNPSPRQGGTPVPGRVVPQSRAGGYPSPRCWVPQYDVPPPPNQDSIGYPHWPDQDGVPPPRTGYTCTGYAVGGAPLAVSHTIIFLLKVSK